MTIRIFDDADEELRERLTEALCDVCQGCEDDGPCTNPFAKERLDALLATIPAVDDDDAAKLKPCPFCGSDAELEHDNDHHGSWFNLGCSKHWDRVELDKACPGARLWYTEDLENEAAAIEAWNTRAAIAALGKPTTS